MANPLESLCRDQRIHRLDQIEGSKGDRTELSHRHQEVPGSRGDRWNKSCRWLAYRVENLFLRLAGTPPLLPPKVHQAAPNEFQCLLGDRVESIRAQQRG